MRSAFVLTLALTILSAPPFTHTAGSAEVIWQTPSYGNHVRCVSSIEDQEGYVPGSEDVLVELDSTGDPDGHLKLLQGNSGEVLWGVSPPGGVSGGCGYGDMCLTWSPDLSGDGVFEALLGTSWGGRTAYALIANSNGRIFWDFDTYVDADESGWVYSIDWIEDVDDDDVPDVIFGCGSDNNTAYCVSGASGTVLWFYPCPDAVYQVAPIGDVNGNGTMDVLVATGDADADYTYCFDGGSSGIPAYLWRFYVGATSYTVTGGDDVNGDGSPEAYVGTWNSAGTVYCVSGADGSQVWAHPVGSYEYVMRVVTIDDLNDDGAADLLVASWDNAIICLDGATGDELWNVPTGSTNGGDVWTIWPIHDVDFDGYDDVVAGSFDLKAYCVSGHTGDIIWTHTVGNRVYTVRSTGDMNFNGTCDALVGTQYYGGTGGRVYCLDGNATGVPPVMYLECTMEGDSVVLTWTFEDDTDVVGYNVYRSALDDIETPEDLHRRLAERSEFSVERALTERAGLGERGGGDFVRLNDELVQECSFTDDAVTDGARYAYMVTAVLTDGTESCLGPEEILVRIGSDGLALACPTPNPFTCRAAIAFSVPGGQPATLAVYTPGGRLVRRLDSSSGRAVWDGRSSQGALVAPGVYLVRLTSEGMSAERKVVFLR